MNELEMWAKRGRWLLEKMSERTTPDGRTVLAISEEPIWAKADGTFFDYCAAVDDAMDADEFACAMPGADESDRERCIEIVMRELDSNGQAQAIALAIRDA
jgi:hypothetical protein